MSRRGAPIPPRRAARSARARAPDARRSADTETDDLIRGVARQQPDGAIAALLNRVGKRTGMGDDGAPQRPLGGDHHRIGMNRHGRSSGKHVRE